MKRLLMAIGLLVIPFALMATQVTFVIENIEHNNGKIYLGVFNEDGFLKRGKQLKECVVSSALHSNRALIRCDLKPGKYAAAVFHDENSNQILDVDFLGFPKEGYGLTNNPNRGFYIPSFDETSFTVSDRSRRLRIDMMY